MAKLQIITLPDPILRKVSAPVERIDEEVLKLADDMLETMYAAPGVGLAAVQVGVLRRLVVLDTAKDEAPPRPLVLINPEIVSLGSEMREHEEGCLSIPDVRVEIERPSQVDRALPRPRGQAAGAGRGGAAGNRHPARDRPPERQADHRFSLPTEARHDRAQVQEEGEGRSDGVSRGGGQTPRNPRVDKQAPTEARGLTPSMRIVFMGTPEFALPTLAGIIAAGHEVAAVYSQPPRPAGRGMAERKSPVHLFAERHGLPVLTPKSLKGEPEQQAFAAHGADVAVVVAYGLILPKPVLAAPRHGCLNLHASALPRWRGAAPIQRAIMAGDAETAATVMRMDEGLDTGPVCREERVPIGPDMTAGELHDLLAVRGAELMVRALAELERGALSCQPQPAAGVTYAAKIDKGETRLDFTLTAREVHDRVRGLSPAPGAWVEVGSCWQGRARESVAHASRGRQRRAGHGSRCRAHRRLRRRRRARARGAALGQKAHGRRRVPARLPAGAWLAPVSRCGGFRACRCGCEPVVDGDAPLPRHARI